MVARIYLWDKLVGAVLWDTEKETAIFEYAPEFIKTGLDVAPLQMPLEEAKFGNRIFAFPALNPETFKGLPGLLADSLPDKYGNAIIDAWLAQKGRNPDSVNAVERLCFIGSRAMGALEFTPAAEGFKDYAETVEIAELIEVAREILYKKQQLKTNLTTNSQEALKSIINVGTSAGGARAKAIVAFNPKSGEIRSGQLPTGQGFEHWIIKFDGMENDTFGNPRGYGLIEYAHYQMAIACGIEMTECRLLHENGRSHFMTKRFDRIGDEKLHFQTLCGMAHYDYNMPGAFSYEQAFQVMRKLRLPYHDAEQMYLRMVFNVMARNQDDHSKNIGFVMHKNGEWRLSPAYDMSYAYNANRGWTMRHQMKINGKTENIRREDLLQVAKAMNIKKPESLLYRIFEVLKNWPEYADNAGVDERQMLEVKKNQQLL